jgi:hypothetical protein
VKDDNTDEIDQQIKDVIEEESSRGQRIADPVERRKHQRRVREVKLALKRKDRRTIVEAIRAYGLKEGTPEFRKAVEILDQILGKH